MTGKVSIISARYGFTSRSQQSTPRQFLYCRKAAGLAAPLSVLARLTRSCCLAGMLLL